jgi:hypothetical protein
MRKFNSAAVALAVTIGMCGQASAADLQAGERITSATHDWYISIAALALQRSTPNDGAIVAANPAGTPFMTGADFDFGWSPGIDAAVGVGLFGNEAIEARVMYSRMDAGYNFTSPGNFIGVGFTGPAGTQFVSEYETTLMSWEVNWRHHYSDRLSVLAGFRSLGIEDIMSTVLNANVATGLYEADNNMLGVQVGAQLSVFEQSNPFQLDVFGKLGVFSNQSEAGIREFQGNNFIGEFQSGSVRETNYAAELGVTAGYRVFENVSLTAGYQLLWVTTWRSPATRPAAACSIQAF